MQKVTQKDGQSTDLIGDNIEQMKRLFPEAFSENGVDFDVLRQLLGDESVLDEGEEKYGLNWHGKKKARQIALTPSMGTLLPCPEESVNWDTTRNLFIEGDNLEVLKLLQKSYSNKVKLIYIDPPYNTGKEFVYPDKYQDNLDTYLKYTGQKGAEGLKLTSNTETGGRKHTNWLNMMYPRLKLAKNLLRKDGIIFISIDDNEQMNLRKICDEIYGKENFIALFTLKSNPRGSQASKLIAMEHEYVLCYCKNNDDVRIAGYEKSENLATDYSLADKKGKYRLLGLRQRGGAWRREDRPAMYYPIYIDPNSGEVSLNPSDKFHKEALPKRPSGEESRWTWGKGKFEKDSHLLLGKSVSREGTDDFWDIFRKDYLHSEDGNISTKKPRSIWDEKEVNYQNARNEIKVLFENSELFDFPKPTFLIQKCIEMIDMDGHIAMDFFAGSGTTAQAIMQSSSNSLKKINFICVQLPEQLDKNSQAGKLGFETISALSMERIRRAGKIIKGDIAKGFKVFKLAQSNIRAWNPDRNNLEETLLSHQEHLLEGRTEQDLLYELLLKRGVELTVPIETREVVGKIIYSIGAGVLFACFCPLKSDEIEPVAESILTWWKDLDPEATTHVFFRDSAFNNDNVAKTNMVAILEQNGITHVRSL